MPEKPWTIVKGDSPLIATAIHNGHKMRDEAKELCALTEQERQYEEDPFTGEFTSWAETRIIAHHSRFEYDLNRPREKAVYRKPKDAWGLKVWKKEPAKDFLEKSLEFYDGFYRELETLLEDAYQKWGKFIVIDIHSYSHQRAGKDKEFAPVDVNPEVIIGTGSLDRNRWGRAVDHFVQELRYFNFLGRNLDVRENVKFPGGNMSKWIHKNFPKKGYSISIEFKKFWMNEWTNEIYTEQFEYIKKALKHTTVGLLDILK